MTTDAAALTFRDSLRRGVRDAIPLAIAVALFGVSFGVLAKSAGFGSLPTVVMTLTTFSGAAQFASISIIRDGGGAAAAITAAALLSARFVPIGLSVAPVLHGRLPLRFVKSQLVIDESWAVAARGGGRFDGGALIGAGILLYVAWLAGTLAGVVGGDLLSDPEALGLDAAFPALFLALLAPNLRKRRLLVAALLGAGTALLLVPFVRPGLPVVAASIACLAGWGRRP